MAPRFSVPAPFEVRTQQFVAGLARDAHNNLVDGWLDPVSQRVYGWTVPASKEPKVAGANRVIVDVELLTPEEFSIGPHDRVWLKDREFEVLGEPEDFNNGPFGFRPGFVVNLQRVEG